MSSRRTRTRLAVESLEGRLALTATAAPVNPTLAVLTAFTHAFLSKFGQPNYNPALDLNHNGQIGQTDAELLLKALPPISPKIPLQLRVALAPEDQFNGPHGAISGGATFNMNPTVIGHTTPGSLVLTGTGTLDLKLGFKAVVADAQGNFSVQVPMSNGINQFDLLVLDPFGHQTRRAFPILWLGFGRFAASHPKNT